MRDGDLGLTLSELARIFGVSSFIRLYVLYQKVSYQFDREATVFNCSGCNSCCLALLDWAIDLGVL